MLAGIHVGEMEASIVVFPDRGLEVSGAGRIESSSIGDHLDQISERDDLAHGRRKGDVLAHHCAEGDGVLELASPHDRTSVDVDKISGPALDVIGLVRNSLP